MKKAALLLAIGVLSATLVSAQNRKQSSYLLISVYTDAGRLAGVHEKVIVTKQDGSQEVIKNHGLGVFAFSSKRINEEEDSLMQMLKPYFDDGWKLVSVSSLTIPQGTSGVLTRYFLSKKEEQTLNSRFIPQ
jgi:ribosomal protein L3